MEIVVVIVIEVVQDIVFIKGVVITKVIEDQALHDVRYPTGNAGSTGSSNVGNNSSCGPGQDR